MATRQKIISISVSPAAAERIELFFKHGELSKWVSDAITQKYPLSIAEIELLIDKLESERKELTDKANERAKQINEEIETYKTILYKKNKDIKEFSEEEFVYFKEAIVILNKDPKKLKAQVKYYNNKFKKQFTIEEYNTKLERYKNDNRII